MRWACPSLFCNLFDLAGEVSGLTRTSRSFDVVQSLLAMMLCCFYFSLVHCYQLGSLMHHFFNSVSVLLLKGKLGFPMTHSVEKFTSRLTYHHPM